MHKEPSVVCTADLEAGLAVYQLFCVFHCFLIIATNYDVMGIVRWRWTLQQPLHSMFTSCQMPIHWRQINHSARLASCSPQTLCSRLEPIWQVQPELPDSGVLWMSVTDKKGSTAIHLMQATKYGRYIILHEHMVPSVKLPVPTISHLSGRKLL